MAIAWHVRDAMEFGRIRSRLESEFPYLHVGTRGGRTVLIGELPLVLDGRVADTFSIEVVIPSDGPRTSVPIVREVGGRIPRVADRHVYRDGTACLFVEAEYWYKHPDGLDLIEFLRGPVTSYFVQQMFYEQEGRWPFGQRSHGAAGVIEFFTPLVGSSDPHVIKRFLEVVVARKLRSRWKCACGSGRHVIDCHGDVVQRLRDRVKRSAARTSLAYLEREIGHFTRRAS